MVVACLRQVMKAFQSIVTATGKIPADSVSFAHYEQVKRHHSTTE